MNSGEEEKLFQHAKHTAYERRLLPPLRTNPRVHFPYFFLVSCRRARAGESREQEEKHPDWK